MFERFTDRARRVVVLAQEEARLLNHNYIGTEHILLGLIHEGEGVAAKALESLGISLEAVRAQVEEIIGHGGQAPSGHIPFTPRAKKVLELSLREALQLGHNYIGTEHILLGLIREGEGVAAQVLVKLGADLSRVRQQVIQLLSGYAGQKEGQAGQGGAPGEAQPSGSLVLDQFGRNLTQLARDKKLDPVIGREKEIERVMQVCHAARRTTPCSSVSPASARPRSSKVSPTTSSSATCPRRSRASSSTRSTSARWLPGRATAATSKSGSRRCSRRSRRAATSSSSSTSCTRSWVPGAAEGAIDAASILKPMLARGELQTIGATTLDEYRKHLEKDAALERRFQPIKVEEPSVPHTIEILKGLRDRYEAHHRVTITDQAIVAAANMADRYISDRHLPDKAIDLIDEAGSRLRIRRMQAPPDYKELEDEIATVRNEKEAAIEAQQFERAASLRDREKELLEQRTAKEVEFQAEGVDLFNEVTEESIAEVLAHVDGHPRVQAHGGRDRQAPPHGRRAAQARGRPARRHQGGVAGDPPDARRASRTRSGRRARSSSSARRAWGRPRPPRRSPSSSSATRAR